MHAKERAKGKFSSLYRAGVRAWHESARNDSHPAAATATEAAQRAGRRIGQPSFAGGGGGLANAANKLEAETRRKDIEVEGGH